MNLHWYPQHRNRIRTLSNIPCRTKIIELMKFSCRKKLCATVQKLSHSSNCCLPPTFHLFQLPPYNFYFTSKNISRDVFREPLVMKLKSLLTGIRLLLICWHRYSRKICRWIIAQRLRRRWNEIACTRSIYWLRSWGNWQHNRRPLLISVHVWWFSTVSILSILVTILWYLNLR